jgi:sodium/hydrogen exchanger 8
VAGTLVATATTWAALYNLGRTNLLYAPLTATEAGAFACLISAVDPVATLATFSSLRVDPRLANLVFGESVLNDAVALILFRSILHYGVFAEFSPGVHLPMVLLSFVVTAVGSLLYGVGIGLGAALLLKGLGLGRSGRMPSVEMGLFWCCSYFAFIGAEVPHLSGIVASLFCGITMRRYGGRGGGQGAGEGARGAGEV